MSHKLLIVDDEVSIADILCETFEDEDIHSLAMYSGNEAIEYLNNNKVDLILSDIQMPNGTGIDILNHIQTLEEPPKIIMMTGYTEYSKDELIGKGALEVFSKPVDLENLIEHVSNLIE